MSDSSVTLVDLDASPEEAERLAEELRDWLVTQRIISAETSDCVLGSEEGHRPGEQFALALDKPEDAESSDLRRLMTNGVEFQVGRTVFDTGGNGTELRCAKCGTRFHADDDDAWMEAVEAWAEEEDDAATYACPHCAHEERLPEWGGEWTWGFGNLGLIFWNWPPLSERFVSEVARKLGHRVKRVYRHL